MIKLSISITKPEYSLQTHRTDRPLTEEGLLRSDMEARLWPGTMGLLACICAACSAHLEVLTLSTCLNCSQFAAKSLLVRPPQQPWLAFLTGKAHYRANIPKYRAPRFQGVLASCPRLQSLSLQGAVGYTAIHDFTDVDHVVAGRRVSSAAQLLTRLRTNLQYADRSSRPSVHFKACA